MLTLCIRYVIDPNRVAHFRAYVEAELEAIHRSGVLVAMNRSIIERVGGGRSS